MTVTMATRARCPVSVVMPCFNAAASVERAIESIADQAAAPLEVIAVDDASGDATGAVLGRLARRPWPFDFHVVTLAENLGPGGARNAGLERVATAAEYVAFQDADDVWLPWKLERQVGWMDRHPRADWTAHRCGMPGRGVAAPDARREPFASPITRRGLLLRNAVATPAVVARRRLPGRFREGWRRCEDLMLWLDWLDGGHEGFMLEETMVRLGRRPRARGGLTGDLSAMHRGEQRVLRTLASEGRMGRGTARLWAGFVWIRYLSRVLPGREKTAARRSLRHEFPRVPRGSGDGVAPLRRHGRGRRWPVPR